jgi:hypothetical protein
MMRPNWLDPLVERFQHNWETNPRYRSIATGVAGLVMVALLCTVMGVAASLAGAVGGSVNGSATNGAYVSNVPGSHTPTPITFPWKLPSPWANPIMPGISPLGPSQTPQPSPTFQPTATIAPSPTCDPNNCNGGPGGPPSNPGGSITGTSPSPLTHGATGYILIHTNAPNTNVVLNINWPNGVSDFPAGSGTSDASGNVSINVGIVPACSPTGATKGVAIHVELSNGSPFSGTVYEKC